MPQSMLDALKQAAGAGDAAQARGSQGARAPQAAVPKFMTLRLEAASGTVLPPHGAGGVTQRLHLTNSQHGAKPVALRLRVSYTLGGAPAVHQVEVKNLPAGL
jgi:AP-1 complex subunit gamma-1